MLITSVSSILRKTVFHLQHRSNLIDNNVDSWMKLGNNSKNMLTDVVGTTTTALASSVSDVNENDGSSSIIFSPRARAGIWMAIAMAIHFGGYEFARNSNLALFTSPETGFVKPYAYPLAMATVSPFSFLLLMGYHRELETNGPRIALRNTTLWSIIIIGLSAFLFQLLAKYPIYIMNNLPLSKVLIALTFLFQNSYAHLLYNQHWSFLSSILSVESGTRWFASIAGLSSLASAFSGTMVSILAQRIGLYGLLGCTAFTLSISLLCAERAYYISKVYNFDPGDEISKKQVEKSRKKEDAQSNLTGKVQKLFQRVPELKALFFEVISFQSMATILNICFVSKLKSTITNDIERAAWTGRFYGSINAVSAAFQFIILPLFLNGIETKLLWKLLPLIPMISCFLMTMNTQASLMVFALAFASAKCLDYSVRGVLTEIVYVPLDFDSRYVGKEINGFFGNRLGKSGMSVLLSAITGVFPNPLGILTKLSVVASLSWGSCSWWLSSLISKSKEAQSAVDRKEKEDDGGSNNGKKTK